VIIGVYNPFEDNDVPMLKFLKHLLLHELSLK